MLDVDGENEGLHAKDTRTHSQRAVILRSATPDKRHTFCPFRILNRMALHVRAVVAAWLTISCISGAAASIPCPSNTISIDISTAGDIQVLADALNCTGDGVYKVTLSSSLRIERRIEVANQKDVTIIGSGYPTLRGAQQTTNEIINSAIDAGGTSGIFLVSSGSTLSINHMVLDGGYSENGGGAVAVVSSSALQVFDCVFSSNVARIGGETCSSQER